jgi:Family of unknown function (DUF5681)
MEDNNTIIKNNQDLPLSNNSTEIEREANGQLKKGVILNPKGKPKGARHFSTLIKEAITRVAEDGGTSDDKEIVKALVKKAKEGELKAIDMVLDRVDGKAEQTINLDGEMTINDGLTQEEKEALLNLLK